MPAVAWMPKWGKGMVYATFSGKESVMAIAITAPHRFQSVSSITEPSRLAAAGLSIIANPWVLLGCKLIIGVVSAYDIFLTIKYVESLPAMELNPIGRWLMYLDAGPECKLDQIAGFIAAKFVGNFLTLAMIELVSCWKRMLATVIASCVAVFQLGLLYFLLSS